MKKVGREQIEQTPRARLIQPEGKVDIYYVTGALLKRRIPSWEVFKSYNNNPAEVVAVKPEELEAYAESRLIRLMGDPQVWYLEGGLRRHVKSPAVMSRRGFKWEHVSPVNFAEYNSYPEGVPLE